jgi:hypothetical protein
MFSCRGFMAEVILDRDGEVDPAGSAEYWSEGGAVPGALLLAPSLGITRG